MSRKMINPNNVQNAFLGLIASSSIISLIIVITSCTLPKELWPIIDDPANDQCLAGYVQDSPDTGTISILKNLSTNPEVEFIKEADYEKVLQLRQRIGAC